MNGIGASDNGSANGSSGSPGKCFPYDSNHDTA